MANAIHVSRPRAEISLAAPSSSILPPLRHFPSPWKLSNLPLFPSSYILLLSISHTEGICGLMVLFRLWVLKYFLWLPFCWLERMRQCHDGSGTCDSWFWNSLNFFREDIMDFSYTYPYLVPIYALNEILEALLGVASSNFTHSTYQKLNRFWISITFAPICRIPN